MSGPLTPRASIFVGIGLGFQVSMEYGIYSERLIFYVKIGMTLIGSKRIREDPKLFSLCFTGMDKESLCLWREGMGGVVDFFLNS